MFNIQAPNVWKKVKHGKNNILFREADSLLQKYYNQRDIF